MTTLWCPLYPVQPPVEEPNSKMNDDYYGIKTS